MQLFAHYIEPFTTWLHLHPEQALIITFFIAFLESLAIIGSVIPGSITMTAVGILAGTGIVRIDLTYLASTLGAIAGDSASYLLGYIYSERLTTLWPFSRYPNLLAYGQYYFEKHGGKSVLIGRFVGPLRSIIPVIAGMLHMPKWRFFIANFFSGMGWSLLYVTPGVLIGTASHELSPERATRLVILILLVLISIWLLTIGIKALFLRFKSWFQRTINDYWTQALSRPMIGPIFQRVTPQHEIHHATTAILFLSCLASFIGFILIACLHYQVTLPTHLNQSIHFLLQSARTHTFEYFFAFVQQSLMLIPVSSLFIVTAVFLAIERDIKAIFQWGLFASLLWFGLYCIHHFLPIGPLPLPNGILGQKTERLFPSTEFTLACACYLSIIFHTQQTSFSYVRPIFSSLLISSLLFGGLSFLYLGDIWLSDLMASSLLASTISLAYWLTHRKTHPYYHSHPSYFPLAGTAVFLIGTLLSCSLYLTQALQNHQIYHAQHIISHVFWWNQDRPIIPLYSRNRIGKINGVFNVQYVGNIKKIELSLNKQGWHIEKKSLLRTVLKHINKQHDAPPLSPLVDCIYLNHAPTLTMVRYLPHQPILFRLQFWRSNYHITSFNYPIWIGHIQKIRYRRPYLMLSQDKALAFFKTQLSGFNLKRIDLPVPPALSLPQLKYMLLIQDETTTPMIQTELFLGK